MDLARWGEARSVGAGGGASGVNRGENGCVAHPESRTPALTPLLLQVCAWGPEARSGP